MGRFGPTVILTDGDVVFQPRKLQRSGLWDAVDGRALIYVHKEKMLDAVERHYPSRHYVMVDDKLRILAAMKAIWRERLTTRFPRQGHYALDPAIVSAQPAADVAIGKTVVSTGLIDRVAGRFGLELDEVPVGFKWFSTRLLDGSLGFAGEESTEDIYKIYGESFSGADHLQRILKEAQAIVDAAISHAGI